jgi:molybdenum cofactor cytidylyltransferase
VGAVVLAAGSGRRFGGGKLLADLDGRPVLDHVLRAVRALSLSRCVVVLGADAARIEQRIAWRGEQRVVNPEPAAGIAGSLQLGVARCLDGLPGLGAVMVVLGDQPRTSPDVMRALLAARADAATAGAWAVAPRYSLGGGTNPVLLLAGGLARVPDLIGDRGMGALLAAEPGRTWSVAVPGSNPDVDTRADLDQLAGRPPSNA